MTGSDSPGVVEIATSCGGELLWQAPASVVSTSSITVRSAASAASVIWTRTVARLASLVKLTWRSACQESAAICSDAPDISMQGRGLPANSPRANRAATASGTTDARRLKRNMALPAHKPAKAGLWLAECKENSLPAGLWGRDVVPTWFSKIGKLTTPPGGCRHPRRRVIQYAAASRFYHRRLGIL